MCRGHFITLLASVVLARASPSLSEDSCVGSGVVLLLSVFWLQLDGWLLAFLRFPFISAWDKVKKRLECKLLKRHCRHDGQ